MNDRSRYHTLSQPEKGRLSRIVVWADINRYSSLNNFPVLRCLKNHADLFKTGSGFPRHRLTVTGGGPSNATHYLITREMCFARFDLFGCCRLRQPDTQVGFPNWRRKRVCAAPLNVEEIGNLRTATNILDDSSANSSCPPNRLILMYVNVQPTST